MEDPVIGLETLLGMDGYVYFFEDKCWIKIEARVVPASKHTPHGVRYCLTLHDRNNTRVLGYDNAHRIEQATRKRFSGRKMKWDHVHKRDEVEPYEFDTAAQLLTDFWNDVDAYMKG